MNTADEIIRILNMKAHPTEGGFFSETYRSVKLTKAAQSDADRKRSLSTAIYYLLKRGTYSEIHRLPFDEIFHFYRGDPVEMICLHPDGSGQIKKIGNDLLKGYRPQIVVPGGSWQGCRLEPGGEYALLGTTMAPGFDYRDYESGDQNKLVAEYPDFEEWIIRLCR